MKLELKIFRFNPDQDEKTSYQTYIVEAEPEMRILDCLNKVFWEQDSSLSYRWSCSHGICGSDGITINGTASLACQKLVRDYEGFKTLVLEPLSFFPIVKDLIVDMEPFFESIRSIHPEMRISFNPVEIVEEIKQTQEEHSEIVDSIKCVMCGCCTASCPVNLRENPKYVGPAAVLRAKRYIFDSRQQDIKERMDKVDEPNGVWGCKSYWNCTKVCPKEIQITKNIFRLKRKLLDRSSATS